MNNKIIVLSGPSSCGKDALMNILNQCGLNFVLSHTTRPMRPNEKQGREYIFTNESEILNMESNDELVEMRKYNTIQNGKDTIWYYAISKDKIKDDNPYVAIVDMQGQKDLKSYYGDRVVSIYIDVDEHIRTERVILRGDYDELEWNRRLIDDAKVFNHEAIGSCDYAINNNYTLIETASMLLSIVNAEIK